MSRVFERTTPLKPACRAFFQIASSKRGLRSNIFYLIPYAQDDDDDHDNLDDDDDDHDNLDDDDDDHDKDMRSSYLNNSSNNANKNEIIHVAKYEFQKRRACQELSCKYAGKHERSDLLQPKPPAYTPPDPNVKMSKRKHLPRVKPWFAKIKRGSRT